MDFLDFDEMVQKYGEGKDISRILDSKRKVYIGSQYVIKRENSFASFLRELNFYSILNHPCILRLEAYSFSFDNGIGFYLVTRKGEDIIEAYNDGIITIEEICSDLLSALSYIHDLGIGHFDIKEFNTVFLEGRAILMDFGLSERCYPYVSNIKDYYCYNNIAYTEGWRDPETSDEYNSIRQDLYALAMTIYDIYVYGDSRGWSRRSDRYYPDMSVINDDRLAGFIEYCMLPLRYRSPTKYLLNHPIIVRKYKGIDPISFYRKNECSTNRERSQIFENVVSFIIDSSLDMNLMAKTVFLSIHIFHMIVDELFGEYESRPSSITDMYFTSLSTIFLVSQFYHDQIDINKLLSNFDKYTINDIIASSFDVIRVLEGRIDHLNYFDYAQNSQQLAILLGDISKCGYDSTKIRKLDGISRLNRDISFYEIYEIYKNTIYSSPNQMIFPFQKDEVFPSESHIKFDSIIDRTIADGNINPLEYHYLLEKPEYFKLLPNQKKLDFGKIMKKTRRGTQILNLLETS